MKTNGFIQSLIILSIILVYNAPSFSYGQDSPIYIDLEEVTLPNTPALQSYVYARHAGKWLLLGGRTDGLHDHRPPFSFLPDNANDLIYVYDPDSDQQWNSSVLTLPTGISEQLLATNIEFTEDSSSLYLVGGYGYSNQQSDHITHPVLTIVDKTGLINAVMNGQSILPYFRQISDNRMAVTGGYLTKIDDVFHLIGGQQFHGRYNPHGPNHGPGFLQEYTNSIRTFEILDDGINFSIQNYGSISDSTLLHRRDFNALPQVFPDGENGVTAFTGVFQYNADVPWLNTIDVTKNTYSSDTGFQQLLNQYHSASFSAFNEADGQMHNFFFGGIGMYYYDQNGTFWEDSTVPFVKTISRVTRFADGHLEEFAYNIEMPAFLGASGAVILNSNAPVEKGILMLQELPEGRQHIGYLFGGIESTDPNIFMMPTGSSNATNRLFKVYVDDQPSNINEAAQIDPEFNCYPNPVTQNLFIDFTLASKSNIRMRVLDIGGKEIEGLIDEVLVSGKHSFQWNTQNRQKGVYICELQIDGRTYIKKFSLN